MSYYHDPEVPAGYQDADIEQAELEAEGERIAALKRSGVCVHEATRRGPHGDERECSGCGRVFADEAAAWDAYLEAIR